MLHADGLPRCPWPKQDPLYVAYHDEEWGVPEYDDRALLREADPRRLPGRAVVDHHLAQARQLPRRLRRLRAGKNRALYAEEGRAADAGRRHRAQPRQDRGRGEFGARLSQDHGKRAGIFRHAVGARRRQADRPQNRQAVRARRPKPKNRARCPRSFSATASNSSGRPSSMPSCRRSAWSTIIW